MCDGLRAPRHMLVEKIVQPYYLASECLLFEDLGAQRL